MCVRVSYQEAPEQVWITLVQVGLQADRKPLCAAPLWLNGSSVGLITRLSLGSSSLTVQPGNLLGNVLSDQHKIPTVLFTMFPGIFLSCFDEESSSVFLSVL